MRIRRRGPGAPLISKTNAATKINDASNLLFPNLNGGTNQYLRRRILPRLPSTSPPNDWRLWGFCAIIFIVALLLLLIVWSTGDFFRNSNLKIPAIFKYPGWIIIIEIIAYVCLAVGTYYGFRNTPPEDKAMVLTLFFFILIFGLYWFILAFQIKNWHSAQYASIVLLFLVAGLGINLSKRSITAGVLYLIFFLVSAYGLYLTSQIYRDNKYSNMLSNAF